MSVYLVGAGPGDPELITVRALELIRACDVLVYDRLVSPELVEEAPADALRIPRDPLTQEQINDLLVSYSRAELEVVRLKGGDPFVFGRGGEEAIALVAADVPYVVVPGVSSLAAVPANAGIPVTHRGISSQVTMVAGQGAELDFGALAEARGTIVIFMGLGRIEEIVAGLLTHGKEPTTPAAVISNGTLPGEEVVTAPLAQISRAAQLLEPPALVVIGDVVSLAPSLTRKEFTSALS